MTRRGTSGTSLLEALVALSILGVALTMGAGFLARRRDLDRERLDRERALRAVRSEWVFLRTASRAELLPANRRGFFGPQEFVDGLGGRAPSLSLRPGPHPDLWFARIDVGYGRQGRRLVEEGWIFAGGGP